jgi:hypothetical protein
MSDPTGSPGTDRAAPVRQAVVVLGMHRSGTSALAGIIAKLGATLPRTLMPADRENPGGYWESDVIYRIHTRLLVALHSEWDSPVPLPVDWWLSDTAKCFEDELVEAVGQEFAEGSLFVLKDPRLCRLLPLWTRVLDRVGARPGYVLLTRNPLEVAASLELRDGFTRERSFLIWLRHLLDAERDTRGTRRTFLTFDTLLENWPGAVRKIAADLGLLWPRSPEACQAEVAAFLAADLRHHRIPDRTALESSIVPVWVRRAYGAAISAASDSQGGAQETTWNELRTRLEDADNLIGPVLATLHDRATLLGRELLRARQQLARAEAERDAVRQHIAAHEVERTSLGAQIGRWLTRRRAAWAPPGSLRGRLVSTVGRQVRRRVPRAGSPAGPIAPELQGDAAAKRRASSSDVRAPASERLCDAVVLAFALWTICAHVVVAAGGELGTLIVLYALASAGGVTLMWRWQGGSLPTPARPVDLSDPHPPRWTPRWLPIAVLIVGLAATLSFAYRPDMLRLWGGAVLLLGMSAIAVIRREVPGIAVPHASRFSEGLLWLLAVACVVVTLVAHRPDADDALYVNVAVTALEAPRQALLHADTLHGIAGLAILPVYRVHSYELWNGALAYLTGIPPIYVFHWISAAVAALMVPLAYAKLFRILTPQWWLWSVAVLVALLIVTGETHRWYGNFAFVRIWQGKAIFLSLVLPLIYVYGVRFGSQPTAWSWILLCAAQIAAVGFTSSALWAAPLSAFLALACTVRPARQSLKIAIAGVVGSAYVLGQAWLVRASLGDLRALWATPGSEPGARLLAAFITTLGDSRLLLFGIGSLLVAGAVSAPGLARRFAVICPLVLLVGLLNPYVADWVSASLTGPSYWRSMWAVPLPILMTLVLTSPLQILRSRPLVARLLCLTLVIAFSLLIPRYGALSPTNGVQLAWPKLKVPEAPYRWAGIVNHSVPPGTLVAVPAAIDPWIGTFHPHAYPLLVRHYLWGQLELERDEIRRRSWLRDSLAFPEWAEAEPQQFRAHLERFQLGAVCMVNSPRGDTARAILGEAGYRRTIRGDDYELWVRPEVSVRAAGADTPGPPVRGTGHAAPAVGASAEPRR